MRSFELSLLLGEELPDPKSSPGAVAVNTRGRRGTPEQSFLQPRVWHLSNPPFITVPYPSPGPPPFWDAALSKPVTLSGATHPPDLPTHDGRGRLTHHGPLDAQILPAKNRRRCRHHHPHRTPTLLRPGSKRTSQPRRDWMWGAWGAARQAMQPASSRAGHLRL